MKKKTDYIEEEGTAYDEDDEVTRKLDRAVYERRMQNWERAAILTQEMAQRAVKGMAVEVKLRIAQILALVAIAFILLAK
jgi:hypothetical protein